MIETALSRLPAPIAHILHVGAGSGTEIPLYLDSGASNITLIEADGEAASDLQARTEDVPYLHVRHAAVSADPTTRPFHLTNFPSLNSFRPAADLLDLFPGYRVRQNDPVTPVAPDKLPGLPGPDDQGSSLLVIEAPGEAMGILEALSASDLLQRFDAVCLQEGAKPLFQDAPALSEIAGFLRAAGFDVTGEETPEDPDLPWLFASVDRAALAAQQAQSEATAETEALRKEIAAAKREKSAEQTKRRKAEKQAKELSAALEKSQSAQADAVAEATSRHAAEMEAFRREQAQMLLAERAKNAETVETLETVHAEATSRHAAELEAMRREHAQGLLGEKAQNAEAIETLKTAHAEELSSLKAQYTADRAEWDISLKDALDEQSKTLNAAHNQQQDEWTAAHKAASDKTLKELSTAQEQLVASQTDTKTLRAKLQEARDETNRLKDVVEAERAENATMALQHSNEIAALQTELDNSSARAEANWADALEQARTEIAGLQAAIEAERSEISAKLQQAQDETARTGDQIKASQNAEAEALAQATSASAKLASTEQELSKIQVELSHRVDRIDVLTKALEDLRAEHAELKAHAETLRDASKNSEALSAEIEAIRETSNAREDELTQRIKALEAEVITTRQTLSSRTDRIGELEKALGEARDAAGTATTTAENTRNELTALREEQDQKASDLDTISTERATFLSERDEAWSEIGRLKGIIEETESEADHMRNDLSISLRIQALRETDLRDLQDRYGELSAQKEKLQAHLAELTDQLNNLLAMDNADG